MNDGIEQRLADNLAIVIGQVVAPRRSVPWCTRQIARRPTYGEASRFVTWACSGWPSS